MSAAILAAAPFAPARDMPTTVPASQPASIAPVQTPQEYVDHLTALLGQGTQPARDEAAERLLSINLPSARDVVLHELSGNDPQAQLACAKAIGEANVLDNRWITPLAALLGRDRFLTEAAAKALSRFDGDPAAYGPMLPLATARQTPGRSAIIQAMGQTVEKPVAQVLLGILNDPTEEAATRASAASALADLSGQAALGLDEAKWNAWSNARSNKAPAAWREQVLTEQHSQIEREADRNQDQLKQFKAAMRGLMADQYARQPANEKTRTLLSFLNSPNPGVREIGAGLVISSVNSGFPVAPEVHARLIELIEDASPEVRQQAIAAVTALVDSNAINTVLTQLQIETNDGLKKDLLRAVGKITKSPAAVPVIRALLDDPSPSVAAEAAKALKALIPSMPMNPADARKLFDSLADAMQARTGAAGQPDAAPGDDELRAALIEAMAALANADSATAMDLFPRLLNQNESPQTRQAALDGLAALGEKAGDVIAQQLQPNVEPDPKVRQAAATALGQVGSFAYAKLLDASSHQQNEPERLVRDAAWKAFQNLLPLPTTTTRDLLQWADLFRQQGDPDRAVVVRRVIAQRMQDAGDEEGLATERQRLGEIYLQSLNQPGEAVPYLRDALAYRETHHAPLQTLAVLIHEAMLAQLQAGQYHDAVKFAEQEIRRDPANQQEVGPALRNAAETLIKKGDVASNRDAALLIRESLNMNPQLDSPYRDDLEQLRQKLPADANNKPG